MNLFRFGLFLLVGMAVSGTALAAEEYGTADISKGEMTIVRNGTKTKLGKDAKKPVRVFVGDVILVGADSRVKLSTVEKTTVTLGSNAAFQVKPWTSKKKQGMFRMLFGRFRASTKGLTGGGQFNVKTATATIGIKGTDYTASVTPQGDVIVMVSESVVQLEGARGDEQDIKPDLLSVVLNGQEATSTALVTEEMVAVISPEKLDSPPVYKEEAKELPAESVLVEVGVVEPKHMVDAKRDKADFRDTIEVEFDDYEPLDLRYKVNPEVYRNLLDRKLYLELRKS